jgi:RNase P/RNase MRP subunit p29
MPLSSIFHRKAKMTELARIVLPPKREESQPLPASSRTVVPPAFPVAGAAHGSAAHGSKPEISLASVVPRIDPDGAKPPGSEATTPGPAPIPLAGEKPSAPLPDLPDAPKVDPEAHKPEPSATPLPKVDPEAHKAASTPAPPIPLAELSAPSGTPEKREFHLANGERVAGTVLSETPEAIYIDHGTLGVLTIPRAQIAKRLVEIILINGDRIVGDIMAETADTLYVRHASLGMLTVPRAQRSTRVVEAILKDGDRILGEVLTETDTFTVIRSATLGTVTVPHSKVSMLNRKIEQIELKALPPPSPELKDKPSL